MVGGHAVNKQPNVWRTDWKTPSKGTVKVRFGFWRPEKPKIYGRFFFVCLLFCFCLEEAGKKEKKNQQNTSSTEPTL